MILFSNDVYYVYLEFFGGLFILFLLLNGCWHIYKQYKKDFRRNQYSFLDFYKMLNGEKNTKNDNFTDDYHFVFSSEFDEYKGDELFIRQLIFEIIGLLASLIGGIWLVMLGIKDFVMILK